MKNSFVRVVSFTRPVCPYSTTLFGSSKFDDFDHRPRLRRIVRDLVVVERAAGRAGCKPHQRIAVGRRHEGAIEQFFVGEPIPLRREFRASGEDPGDAHLSNRGSHGFQPQGERFEQLRRREHASDIVARLKDGHRLIDHMIFVRLEMFAPALLDELDHPPRIEIDAEADAATNLREVFDAKAETSRTRRPEHEPVAAAREMLVREVCC